MIKFENAEVVGWEAAIRGMRNPKNSWDRIDTEYRDEDTGIEKDVPAIGPNDLALMNALAKGGSVHAKYRRMIVVYVDIVAPLYWWKEFDTYKVGTVANSCSTMHKLADKEFKLTDFSCEKLIGNSTGHDDGDGISIPDYEYYQYFAPLDILGRWIIPALNQCRIMYRKTKNKEYWWQMIQLLPLSYNQRRTVMLNYEVLANIYRSRKDHKLDEWRIFCDEWITSLPFAELITGEDNSDE